MGSCRVRAQVSAFLPGTICFVNPDLSNRIGVIATLYCLKAAPSGSYWVLPSAARGVLFPVRHLDSVPAVVA